jgi:hypothetical protein
MYRDMGFHDFVHMSERLIVAHMLWIYDVYHATDRRFIRG